MNRPRHMVDACSPMHVLEAIVALHGAQTTWAVMPYFCTASETEGDVSGPWAKPNYFTTLLSSSIVGQRWQFVWASSTRYVSKFGSSKNVWFSIAYFPTSPRPKAYPPYIHAHSL